MTSAISAFLLEISCVYSTIARCGPGVIAASGHLSLRLAELTAFLLAATVLVSTAFLSSRGEGFAAINHLAQEKQLIRAKAA
jgi:hypothetical protein